MQTSAVRRGPLAILFGRLGPYHHSRLEATAAISEVSAVEASSVDTTYAWEAIAASAKFRSYTLFTDANAEDKPLRQLLAKTHGVLDEIGPRSVAIPGWSSRPGLLALEWCLRHEVPAILMSDSQETDAERRFLTELVKKRIVRLFSAALVAGSSHKRYLEKLGMPAGRIFLGYDTVDNEHFAVGADLARRGDARWREQLGLPENYFLASSRFVAKKNLTRLLLAYAEYRSRIGASAWKLVLLGDGELKSEVERLRLKLGLVDDVTLAGFKQYDDLPAYYGLAKAFVHASTVEQWGLVVNEAMAAGLPVLVSRTCGCSEELVHDGVNGRTFDPMQIYELSNLFDWMSDKDRDLDAMGRASREIISRWNLSRFTGGMLQAADVAESLPPRQPSTIDYLMIRGLVLR